LSKSRFLLSFKAHNASAASCLLIVWPLIEPLVSLVLLGSGICPQAEVSQLSRLGAGSLDYLRHYLIAALYLIDESNCILSLRASPPHSGKSRRSISCKVRELNTASAGSWLDPSYLLILTHKERNSRTKNWNPKRAKEIFRSNRDNGARSTVHAGKPGQKLID
jgi:hypothetical protein